MPRPITLFVYAPAGFRCIELADAFDMARTVDEVFGRTGASPRCYEGAFDVPSPAGEGRRITGLWLADLTDAERLHPTARVVTAAGGRSRFAYGPLVVCTTDEWGTPQAAAPAERALLTPAARTGPWDLDLSPAP